jgi:hypothetical protein
MNRPGFLEIVLRESSHLGWSFDDIMVVRMELDMGNVPDRLEGPAVVEPVGIASRGQHGAKRRRARPRAAVIRYGSRGDTLTQPLSRESPKGKTTPPSDINTQRPIRIDTEVDQQVVSAHPSGPTFHTWCFE